MSDSATSPDVIAEILAGDSLGLAAAAQIVPTYRSGSRSTKINPSTVYRWIVGGVKLANGKRVYLEAGRIGSRYVTSAAALERFIRAQTTPRADDAQAQASTPRQRARRAAATAKELDKIGL